jgi:polysaccharide biosynthesis transport protein
MSKPDSLATQLTPSALGSFIATQLKLIQDVQTAGLVVDNLGWATEANNQAAFEAAGRPGGDIRDWLAQRIVANTEAKFLEQSSIIDIGYSGPDPAQAQALAEAIREAFLQMNRTQRLNNAQRAAASYVEQANRTLAEVNKAEVERTKFAKANGIIIQPGNVDLESSKLSALSSASVAPTAPTVTQSAGADPQVAMLRQQIAQAQQTLGPNHPTYQALQRQLAAVQSQGGRGGSTVTPGTTRAQIESAYQAQKARVLAQSDKIDRLNQMQADIAIRREQYLKLSAKAEELKAQAGSNDTTLEPLGNTNLPDEPSWPNKPLTIGASIAGGLVLGILLALLVELLARRVRGPDDLEYAAGAPVLAVVGRPASRSAWTEKLMRLIDRDRARERALAEA